MHPNLLKAHVAQHTVSARFLLEWLLILDGLMAFPVIISYSEETVLILLNSFALQAT